MTQQEQTAKRTVHLEITEDDLPAFLACLALGALHAFSSGVPQAGGSLVTLSVPKTWEPIQDVPGVSQQLVEVLRWADDLTVLQEHYSPEKFEKLLAERISVLEAELSRGEPNRIWGIRWSLER